MAPAISALAFSLLLTSAGALQLGKQGNLDGSEKLASPTQCQAEANTIVGKGGDPRYGSCCQQFRAGDPLKAPSGPLDSAEDVVAKTAGRDRWFTYFYLVNHETKTLYYKIPKSSSSFIASFLRRRGYEELVLDSEAIRNGDDKAYSDYCAFSFVRSPLSRAMSAYYTANQLHFTPPELDKNYKGSNKPQFRKGDCFPYLSAKGEPARFSQYVDDLNTVLSTDGHLDVDNCSPNWEGHSLTQFDYLNSLKNVNISFVGRTESLADDWNKLAQVCPGVPSDMEEWIATAPAAFENSWADYCYMCHEDLRLGAAENGTWSSKLPWCTKPACVAVERKEVAQALTAHYWKDLACFGYDMPEMPAGAAL